ncbi:MAG: copper-binding protein [Rhodanobacter sp. SCN 65-17]|jgi:Cu(I)/Ag(I) efflux system protein CusF|uniref:copper-binding protein n=1 Tax=Rhodanobacter sp. PCA2 TaxID=2006117 RepID=UPI00086F7809|nr:copper-binding protein [Rhodanobacter sp. PCA2]MBA2079435.1 copper-binding protein [Rhodanobacter sp. PCA2]ODU66825.1 MAG: copper-binding protein [Rhodanobacter sp. SCN 65-17]
MKTTLTTLCLVGTFAIAPAFAGPLQMNPNMPGMQHDAGKPAEAQAVGVVKAIDARASTITLQHEAIPAIGWPAMTMPFHVSSKILKQVKIGQKVHFTLHPDGMRSEVTALKPVQ